jgi:chromatin segregation and condensation protein Rec8/ScpA/Scc1 (kleisin family)
VARTITLEDRARVIRKALESAPQIVLQDLLGDVRDRVVIAVTFLAMLELAKGREITVEQAEPWGPIWVVQRGKHDKGVGVDKPAGMPNDG